MNKRNLQLQAVREQIDLLCTELINLERDIKAESQEWDYANQIDCGFQLRELGAKLDEMRKDANAHEGLVSRRFAHKVLSDATAMQKPDMLHGELAHGEPVLKQAAKLPSKTAEPERYEAVLDWLGITEEKRNLIRLDWVEVTEFVTRCGEQAKNVPECFGQVFPLLKATYRRKKTNYGQD